MRPFQAPTWRTITALSAPGKQELRRGRLIDSLRKHLSRECVCLCESGTNRVIGGAGQGCFDEAWILCTQNLWILRKRHVSGEPKRKHHSSLSDGHAGKSEFQSESNCLSPFGRRVMQKSSGLRTNGCCTPIEGGARLAGVATPQECTRLLLVFERPLPQPHAPVWRGSLEPPARVCCPRRPLVPAGPRRDDSFHNTESNAQDSVPEAKRASRSHTQTLSLSDWIGASRDPPSQPRTCTGCRAPRAPVQPSPSVAEGACRASPAQLGRWRGSIASERSRPSPRAARVDSGSSRAACAWGRKARSTKHEGGGAVAWAAATCRGGGVGGVGQAVQQLGGASGRAGASRPALRPAF